MTIPRLPSLTDPLTGHPVGVDASWRVPRRLRPTARDLPALAWLAARRCNGGPDEGDVDRYRAAAALPVWLVLLAVQHATATLAARGRDAFVVLAPTWSAARGPYRAVKCAALVGGAVLAVLVAVAGCIVVLALAAVGLVLGVPRPAVVFAELCLPALLVAVWGVGLLAHPFRRVLTSEVGHWAAGRRTAAAVPDHRTVLAATLCGRGRPSVAAGLLGRDVLELADAHGWALLTNGGVPEHTARQYARLGFAWLPDSTRRMLRPAARSVLVDVALQSTADLAGRVGVRLDEVRLVDADSARAGRARGRAFVDLPAEYLIDRTVPDYARAAMAHEVGHHALVVRNGRARERKLTVGSGTVPIRAPRVNDKRVDAQTGERQKFSSKILPGYARRSPKVTEVLPVLYLHGLSTGDFEPALRDLLGEDASGLSPASIRRLTKAWQAEHEQLRTRTLRFHRYAFLFVDGVHVSVRLGEDDRLCLLVVIGVREDGVKELLAVEDGYRESTDSWAQVLRDLRDRGLNEPRLVTGDGALGAWAALRDVFPAAGEQRCWVHKIANVLDAMPKRLQRRAKTLLHQMMEAPTEVDARRSRETFRTEFAARYPKAIDKLDRDWKQLTAFYASPAEHWRHLRTTSPLESSFATVKLRTRVTKGAGSKTAALGMAFKLLKTAEERWRRFNGHELVADALAGATFRDGIRVPDEHPTTTDEKVAA